MKLYKTHLWLGGPPAKDDRYPKAINIINEESRISYVDLTLPKNDDLKFAYYIESNTFGITLEELTEKNVIPTFCDNSLTISHQNFIGAVTEAAGQVFGEMTPVECRVSHPIIGRIPSAQHKKASELREDEKTIFYQRLAWVSHVKGLVQSVNGQSVNLTIGGVRSYSEDKLYRGQTAMKFKIFVGWKVKVCSNLCLTCDGFSGTIECLTEADITQKALELFSSFNPHKEETLGLLENLRNTEISEKLFCKIIGRLRLYQFLPVSEQRNLPSLNIGDQAVNAMVKGYVSNPNFGKKEGEEITCWNLLQYANEAVKSAYIVIFSKCPLKIKIAHEGAPLIPSCTIFIVIFLCFIA